MDYVVGFLLKDGWHKVVDKSFEIDAYEFIHRDDPQQSDFQIRVGGGTVAGVSATGATWKEPDGSWTACPLPSILAVRYKFPRKKG